MEIVMLTDLIERFSSECVSRISLSVLYILHDVLLLINFEACFALLCCETCDT